MSIAENIARIRAQMNEAAIACGRDPKEILLCAATKMNDADAVRQAIAAGVDCCGENRAQELTAKLQEDAYRGKPVHFIGRLQTNKVKQVVGKVDLIQSVDRENLLQAIQKGGFLPEEIHPTLQKMEHFPNIRIQGLMAIPPICQNTTDNDKFFQEMCNIGVDIMAKKYDNVCVDIMSMGMSGDFERAIACGSTMIRVGTAIFGARNYTKSHQA